MLQRILILLLLCLSYRPSMAWEKASQLPERVKQLELDPKTTDLLFAVTSTQLYRSTDAGLTWSKPGVQGRGQVAVHPQNSTVYALFENDVNGSKITTLWVSHDLGATFLVQRKFDSLASPVPDRIFLDPYRGERLYAIDRTGKPLISLNDGQKWRILRAPEGFRFAQIYVSSLNQDALYLSGTQANGLSGGPSTLFISHDQGKTWTLLTQRPPDCTPQRFYNDPFFARIIVSSCDGTKTLIKSGEKAISNLRRVTSIVSVPGVFICLFALNDRADNSGNNLWIGVNGGQSWQAVNSLDGKITAVTVLNDPDKWVIVATRTGGIYRRKLSSFS